MHECVHIVLFFFTFLLEHAAFFSFFLEHAVCPSFLPSFLPFFVAHTVLLLDLSCTHRVRGVDVRGPLEVLQHPLQVAAAGRAQEAGVVVRLQKKERKRDRVTTWPAANVAVRDESVQIIAVFWRGKKERERERETKQGCRALSARKICRNSAS